MADRHHESDGLSRRLTGLGADESEEVDECVCRGSLGRGFAACQTTTAWGESFDEVRC